MSCGGILPPLSDGIPPYVRPMHLMFSFACVLLYFNRIQLVYRSCFLPVSRSVVWQNPVGPSGKPASRRGSKGTVAMVTLSVSLPS